MSAALGLLAAMAALWWSLFGLQPYALTPEQWQQRYALPAAAEPPEMQRTAEPQHAELLRFRSFDGDPVIGRIRYPSDPALATRPFPVLLALHGLGRTHQRWWLAELRGRPTIESTHRLTELALQQGYAVIALDARRHGQREPGFVASGLLRDLKLWGQREPYERMVIDTVRDWRVLLDWVQQQPQLDASRIQAAGYSMGAQMALLLAGADARVAAVAAMVPPHLDDTVAAVAPRHALARLANTKVWLLSADDDDYASAAQNVALFDALPGPRKNHLRFASGHVLPPDYVPQLAAWFSE